MQAQTAPGGRGELGVVRDVDQGRPKLAVEVQEEVVNALRGKGTFKKNF